MDGVCKELDEVKSELEKLKEDYQIKVELSESLRRAHNDKAQKFQDAKLQIEKQAKELNAKSEEISEVRQLYEDIKLKLHETEVSLKQVTSINDKFRIDSGEKMQKLEVENRKLLTALEEATRRNEGLEKKLCAQIEEIQGLKVLLSDAQKKCLEAEEKARAGKELRQRDDVISRLEEQSMNIQDQLKWKKEQFQHLEEAHRLLQDQFQSSKKEWGSEKSALLEEISTLQSNLDSQIRIAESLESRLELCNQALVHEESRRKLLEVQLSETKQCFENVLAECEEAKSRIGSLSAKRDAEIAGLRNSLGMKETLMKEMEYRLVHLEQENKELLGSVKELQEAQISKRKPDTSLTKLRNKLKELEQLHSKCALTLKEREAEWNSKMEKLIGDMKGYEDDLKTQTELMRQLKVQLDNCHSAIEVSGEEISILLMVFKSELSDAYSKLFSSEAQIETLNEEIREKSAVVSGDHLDIEHCSVFQAQGDLQHARKEIESLTQKLDSLQSLEEHSTILEKELEEHKKLLEDSSGCQLRLKEQISQMEVALKNVSDALEKSNSKLAVKISEASQAEMELQMWKSKVEGLRTCLKDSQEICKQLETSLLKQVEKEQVLRKENESLQCRLKEQEKRIDDLQQKNATLDQKLVESEAAKEEMKLEVSDAYKKKVESVQGFRKENDHLQCRLKEEELRINDLQQNNATLYQKLVEAQEAHESIKSEVARANKKVEDYVQIIKENDAKVENLLKEKETIKQQSVRRESQAVESARLEAEKKFEIEKEKLCEITREKDECIMSLQGLASSLEQNFLDMFLFSLSQGVENLVKMTALENALKTTESHTNTEMEKKKKALDVIATEVGDLRTKVLLQEKALYHSEQLAKKLEERLHDKELEMEKLACQFRDEKSKLKELVKDLEQEKEAATESISRLSSERESLLIYIQESCEQIGEFCAKDLMLEGMFGKILQNCKEDATFDSGTKLSDVNYSRKTKEVEASLDRSPLKEINQ